uniref:Uncharacterized protein n=1 Tax=Physcomitrium patens TaxID=3218 RepID=A0A2K1KK78_PHYPA|nr:hypothetical protein PHYPA_007852 [Physcomitrium patens]
MPTNAHGPTPSTFPTRLHAPPLPRIPASILAFHNTPVSAPEMGALHPPSTTHLLLPLPCLAFAPPTTSQPPNSTTLAAAQTRIKTAPDHLPCYHCDSSTFLPKHDSHRPHPTAHSSCLRASIPIYTTHELSPLI